MEPAPDPDPAGPPVEPAPAPEPGPGSVPPDVYDPHPLIFTGTGKEYFRIWIVNLALTIVTLGVYSAWAKVRRLQYFYRNTQLAGVVFDYHGNPIAILKGRIVALILFGLYSAAGYVSVPVAIGIFVVLAAVLPWLISRSLRFRAHNSSYRGLRFAFHGTTREAYMAFLALPIATVLTLLIMGPFWHHRLKRYQFANAAYGRTRFAMSTHVGDFYLAYLLALMLGFGFLFVAFALLFGVAIAIAAIGVANGGGDAEPPLALVLGLGFGFALVYVMGMFAARALTNARIHNAVWNGLTLERCRFVSSVSPVRLFWILFTNLLGLIFTLGLYRPFAQVRLARYLTSTFTLVPRGSLDGFAAADAEDVAAVGEETADLFDFDIAF